MGKRLCFIKQNLIAFLCGLLIFIFCSSNVLAKNTIIPIKNNENVASSPKPVLNIEHWQTKQQVPVYFVETPEIPMVIINVIFTAGSAYDENHWGVAQITANLLGEGTKDKTADQIANEFADVGAEFDADVNQDMAVVSLKSLSEPKYLQPAFNLFTDILAHAVFKPDAFSQQQKLSLAAIKQSQQDPESVALMAFYKTLYQEHPYAHPVYGTLDTVNKLTVDDATHFYQRFYVANNAKIVIVGDLRKIDAEKLTDDLTNTLSNGEAAPKLPLPNTSQVQSKEHILFPANQTTMIIGQIGITRNDPNYFPLFVGNYVLGDLPLESLLFEEVRKNRGLSYDASSSFIPYLVPGPFVIELQTRKEAADEALNVTEQTLQKFLTEGPTDAQLNLAKKLIINSFPISLATNDNISSVLCKMLFYGLPLNYLDTYRTKIQAVTKDQIKQAFIHHIDQNKMITITVGPKYDPGTYLTKNPD